MSERLRIADLERHQPGPDDRWPDELPFPHPESPSESDERIAIELYYMALGVDLHHEFTHLKRGHSAEHGIVAMEQEIEADIEAAEWLLADIRQDDPRFDKRLLGVAISHLYDVFLKLEGHDSDDLHPPLVARIWNRMDQHAPDPDHIVWAFVAAALSLHLELSGRKEYDRRRHFRTFREQVDYLLNVYAPPRLEGL
jgi:Peptidase U49